MKLFKNLRRFSSTIQRNTYKTLSNEDINYFKTLLPPECIQSEDLDYFNTDYLKKYIGQSKLVLKPKTTEEVSAILKYCNSQKLAICPQGGNTGLVGGSVPVFDEIILSLSKMSKIIGFDEITGNLHCEAGAILETLNNYVETKGYTMPLDLGAKGSCQIGGNLATNAGGIHFVRHGSMRKNCKGLKAVTADGLIIDSLNPLPKNNTGYDLKQLFIGSEGTLGIITECLIGCPFNAKYKDVALLGFNNFEDILETYKKSKLILGSNLSAIEFFDAQSLQLLEKHERHSPLEAKYKFYLVIEAASNNENNVELLENFSTEIPMEDGVIAQGEVQKTQIWEMREILQELASREGIVLSYDLSIPLPLFYEIVNETRKRLGDNAFVISYGHIGDYNIHINVVYNKFIKDENYYKLEKIMEPFIYDYIKGCKGSISAEHGIGLHKPDFLNRSQSDEAILLMKTIKKAMDPNNILNPYKVLRI